MVNISDHIDFFLGSSAKNDAIGLDALVHARLNTPLWRLLSIKPRSPKPGAPPWRKPNSISRPWPAKTLAESSRLYSPAIARLTPLTMVETGLPSFSNCSAQ